MQVRSERSLISATPLCSPFDSQKCCGLYLGIVGAAANDCARLSVTQGDLKGTSLLSSSTSQKEPYKEGGAREQKLGREIQHSGLGLNHSVVTYHF